MKIIVYEPNKEPYIEDIDGSLKSMQGVVGGYIETLSLMSDCVIVCNEEGALMSLPLNNRGWIKLFGTFFLCKAKGEELVGFGKKEIDEVRRMCPRNQQLNDAYSAGILSRATGSDRVYTAGGKQRIKEGPRMTAKEFLQQYLNAEHAINAKLEEISRLRALAMRTTIVPDEDHVFVQSSAGDRMATIVGKIVDLEREVDKEIDELQEIRRRVQTAIDSIPNADQRNVLALRYIKGLRFNVIAEQLTYHYRWVLELHGRGLKAIEKTQH